MAKLIPLILILLGLGGGLGAGLALRPPAPDGCKGGDGAYAEADGEAASADPAAKAEDCVAKDEKEEKDQSPSAFADLARQFVVPLVNGERVTALVVASIAVEVGEGETEGVFAVEPKLRDAFLDVLFVHAHSGGFDGALTSSSALSDLKARLKEAAEPIVGTSLRDILVTEIVRQDL